MWCGEYNFSRIWKINNKELLFTRCMSSSDTLNGKDLRSCSKFDSGHRPAPLNLLVQSMGFMLRLPIVAGLNSKTS